MIKLVDLLKEALDKPKAIFLAGPAGSGKSYISKQLVPSSFITINVDDTYEDLLKKSGLGTNIKDFTSDQLAQAAKFMGQAQKITKEKLASLSKEKNNLVIDGTGAAVKPLLKKKEELESLGYDTFMIMIYVSPITSLERNISRDRSLLPSIVLRTWRDVNKNIDEYKSIFGDKIAIINNDPQQAKKGFDVEYIKTKFLDTAKAKGKEKSPEEIEKSQKEKEQLNKDIESLVQKSYDFDTLETAKAKINTFIGK
jgi:dephospho-CoA kinase